MMNTAARSHTSSAPNLASTGLPAVGGASASVIFVDPSIQGSIRITESHKIAQKTRNDYCRRLDRVILWIEERVNDGKIQLSESLIRNLTDVEKCDKDNFYQSTKDLNYNILPVDIIKAFISSNKFKPTSTTENPEQYGFDHLRKYHDSILYGAARVKKLLPVGYKEEMGTFLESLEKERTAARKRGELTEEEADPIPYPLYRIICDYAINMGDAFLWCFTILVWHCMGRPINIDDITLNHFTLGVDSVIVKFSDTKKDKKGKRCSPKNCYSQTLDPVVCLTTALGVYLITADNEWTSENKKALFILPGSKEGSASSANLVIWQRNWQPRFLNIVASITLTRTD
jgi:hypothetical protein